MNNNEKKHHYVYIVTNVINKKQYVGDHSTNDLNDTYLGSGLAILRAIRKYGDKNFIREILETFDTKNEAFTAQEKYIIQYNTLRPNGYNISPKGGHNVKDCFSEESKRKISKNRSGIASWNKGKKYSEEQKQKMQKPKSALHKEHLSKALKGREPWNKDKTGVCSIETREKLSTNAKKRIGNKNPFFGKKHSDKTRKKMVDNHPDMSGERNGMFGNTHSKEARDKISKARKGKKLSEEHIKKLIETRRGEKNGRCKLKNNDVFDIIQHLTNGKTVSELALQYKVSVGAISHIKTGKRKFLNS